MNRETWLNDLAKLMAPRFEELGFPLPKFHAAIGFPSSGKNGNVTAECWNAAASADQAYQIFIRPDTDDPVVIGGSLAHELCHAAAGFECGHKGNFAKLMMALGYVRPVTSTNPSAASDAWIKPLIAQLVPIPHARLSWFGSRGFAMPAPVAASVRVDGPQDDQEAAQAAPVPTSSNAKPKQTTRMLKASCAVMLGCDTEEVCGYTVRLSKKWADKHGACCPVHGPMEMADE